jgi:Zn-dependent protease with chaperone function
VHTEEELAAVIGHEISHVLLRHSAEQMGSTALMNYFFFLLALLGLPVNELTLLLGGAGGRAGGRADGRAGGRASARLASSIKVDAMTPVVFAQQERLPKDIGG